jgi:1,4-dihydroxy-2-naphthoate octaprenyltransferase
MNPVLIRKDTLKLLRIPFSLFLMPVFLLCLSQTPLRDVTAAVWAFVIIHLLVYPSSNGYNSYIDRDEGSIGGLEKPPLPEKDLYYTTLILDGLAVLLSVIAVNVLFALCVGIYIAVSRAYSSPHIRLKKRPLAGFLAVMIFQGALVYFMSYSAFTGASLPLQQSTVLIVLACSLQIGAAYPLTQIYQHDADRAAGDKTISLVLGIRGTFVFSGILFVLCNLCYFFYFRELDQTRLFIYLQLFFVPVAFYFVSWAAAAWNDPVHASYKRTMKMNLVASVCASACFLFFIFIKS